MFRKRRLQPTDRKMARGVCNLMASVTAVRVKSPVEDFYCDKVPCVHSKDDACVYRNDIFMVLNQKRLDSMTLAQFSDWLDHDRSASSLSEVRKNMTDSQLLQFVKSRYIQHPAELQSWMSYLQTNYESEVAKFNEANKPALAAPADSAPAGES